MRKRLHLSIHGRVQGVFYRASARTEARRLHLSGWVRNRNDGSVELLAEGEESRLGQLIAWSQDGPPAARVDHVDIRWGEARGDLGPFITRYDTDPLSLDIPVSEPLDPPLETPIDEKEGDLQRA